ncbi:MAG: hypothetical protein ACYCU0_04170 [Solirubrobacteraceae bacterium]
MGVLAVAFLIVVSVNTILTAPRGAAGLRRGTKMPPFAAPLVDSKLEGSVNVTIRANETGLKAMPACQVRGADVVNACELYSERPVVVALVYTDDKSCTAPVLRQLEALVPVFPQVGFVAVLLLGERSTARGLLRSAGVTFPVGFDPTGALAYLFDDATCPQINFAYRGGVIQSKAMLVVPRLAELRRRITGLLKAERIRQEAKLAN